MAATYVGRSTVQNTDLSVFNGYYSSSGAHRARGIVPPGIAAGDLLIQVNAFYFGESSGTYTATPPAGWTLVPNSRSREGGFTWDIYYKFVTSEAPDQVIDWAYSGYPTNDYMFSTMLAFRGVNQSSPFLAADQKSDSDATRATNPAPTVPNQGYVLAGWYRETGGTQNGPFVGDPGAPYTWFGGQTVGGYINIGVGTAGYQMGAGGTVQGKVDTGSGNPRSSFTVVMNGNSPPAVPTLVSPSGSIGTVKPLLKATVSDPDGGSVYAYFQVATDSGFTNVVAQGQGSTVSSGTTSEWRVPNDLNSAQTYYWRAYGSDGNVNSGWSGAASFTTPPLAVSTYTYTGGQQNFVVPAGVSTVIVECWGAQGGTVQGYDGGQGGYAKSQLGVAAGETLYLFVGGQGASGAAGYNGGGVAQSSNGGGGGGGSDLRQGGTALANRKCIGAGGGGAGWYPSNQNGGGGGGVGGAGGGTSGLEGQGNYRGYGGTQTAGGAITNNRNDGQTAGSLGQGGTGGSLGGGGGGGGYFGGGGGYYHDANGGTAPGTNGGGGGGSSYAEGSGNTTTTGGRAGHGQVSVSYAQYNETVNNNPNAPTLVSPAAGAVLPRVNQFFDWTHSDPDSDGQGGYAIRLTSVATGTSYWWNGSDFVTNEVFVSSASDSATLNTAQIPAGGYNWSVATTDTRGGKGPYSATRAVTINSSPNAPTLLAPANNSAPDVAAGYAFDWTHSDPEGDAQTHWTMRRKVSGGAYEYYNVGTAAWQSTEVANSSATDGYTFPSGKWAAGTAYQWSVKTRDAGSTVDGAWAADFNLSAQAPPSAPTLVSPPNGVYVNLADGELFDWTFADPNVGETQSAFSFRRKISGAATYEYYNVATAAWQATEVWNSRTVDDFTFPASKWINGNIYNWSVATKDAPGNIGPYSSDFTVVGSTPPTLTVTAPSGEVAGTTRPTVVWTYNDPDNQPQTNYRVKVYDQATYDVAGFNPSTTPGAFLDSGEVASATTSYALTKDIVVGTRYRAYVRVGQAGGQYSEWVFTEFISAVETPATPTFGVMIDANNNLVTLKVNGRENILSTANASFEAAGTWVNDRLMGLQLVTSIPTAGDFRGVGQTFAGAIAAGATASLTLPAGVVAGDAMLLAVVVDGTNSVTTPAGWTLLTNISAGGATDARTYVFGRDYVAGDGGPSWVQTNAGDTACYVVAYQGHTVAGAVVAGANSATGATATTAGGVGVTPTGKLNTRLCFIYGDRLPVAGAQSATQAPGMTERVDINGGTTMHVAHADQPYAPSTATGSRVATFALAANHANVQVALPSTGAAIVPDQGAQMLLADSRTSDDTTVHVRSDNGVSQMPQVQAGQPIAATVRVRPLNNTNQRIYAQLNFYDEAAVQVGSVLTSDAAVTQKAAGQWHTLTLTGSVPPGATRVRMFVVFDQPANGMIGDGYLIDRAAIKLGTDPTWTRGGLAGLVDVTVESSDDAGVTWQLLRYGQAVRLPAPSQEVYIYDYEAPPNQERLYRLKTSVVI